ncbi:SirB2 family protein [Motilimonas cestriensis]|uniref:SirB2 family protein n=1 Tax=Motilimonas cestriensis TaxID=2742685 RepID=A0ABS8W646_9GAMM|nr:SirB2 family protein [Motilimonas cestriensis]MCE2593562.1 SirB2 family protein [Motilimonas cestriensis]
MYMAFKHSHFLFIGLTVLLFIARFVLVLTASRFAANKAVIGAYMASLTGLVITGVGLIAVTGFMPFTVEHVWLTEKVLAFVAVLVLQYMALKGGRTKSMKVFAFIGAISWIGYMAHLAIKHQPMLLG